MLTQQQRDILRIAAAMVSAVRDCGPTGAPGGVMYAALMGKMTLQQFESLMGLCVRAGAVRKAGDVYYYVRELPAPPVAA